MRCIRYEIVTLERSTLPVNIGERLTLNVRGLN